jgi:hypothetical protein
MSDGCHSLGPRHSREKQTVATVFNETETVGSYSLLHSGFDESVGIKRAQSLYQHITVNQHNDLVGVLGKSDFNRVTV